MKASVHLLTGCVALGLALPAIHGQAATLPASGVTATLLTFGQTAGGPDSRRQADELLRQARKALKDGQLDQADKLITQAEQTGVKYDLLTARFVDTPESLRKLLNEERAKANQGVQRPSSLFPALTKREEPQQPQAIPSDPFAGQKRQEVVDRLTDDNKARAVGFIQEARAAMQRGDRTGAMAAYQKAIGVPANFGPQEDSPQRLAADLGAMGIDVSRLAPAPAGPAAPFTLKPSDIDPAGDRLPLLPSNGPAAMQGNQPTPYNVQPVRNPLDPAAQNRPSAPPQMLPPGSAPPRTPQYQISDFALPVTQPARPGSTTPAKAEAQRLIAQARMALDKGDLQSAARLADQAQNLKVPEDAYGPEETRPWQIHLEISKARVRGQGVVQAAGATPEQGEPRYPVAQGNYNPASDTTRTQPASSAASMQRQDGASSAGQRLYEEGLRALDAQDRELALEKFSEAWKHQDELDPETRSQLKDKLTFLRVAPPAAPGLPANPGASPIDQVSSAQELNRQRLFREIANEQKSAEQLAQKDPRTALGNLKKVRERVVSADVSQAARKQLLTLVDKSIAELDTYITRNKGAIENEERNNEIRAEIVRNEELTIQTQDKLASMVEEFNKLMDERRYAEAEIIAKQANEMLPGDPVVVLLMEKSRFARNIAANESIKREKENGFIDAMISVERSSKPFDDSEPIVFDVKRWEQLTKSRRALFSERSKLSPVEQEIERALSKPVEVRFDSRPLQEVMDTLGSMAGVNVYLDPQGLHAEGVGSDTAVSINLTQPISLKSALNLVLEPLGLSYVIQNEVLKITSEQTRDSSVYAKVYYVADLVVPIPNFAPSYNLGLPGALRESLNSLGYGAPMRPSASGPLTIATNEPNQGSQQINPLTMQPVMAQASMANSPLMGPPGSRGSQQLGSGPGGLGGGMQADFDPLIELITTTISPTSWDEVGGPGTVKEFESNLSLVVSQTQDVHEKIADLLEQLRRLQDLQVTIEVRFITLSDRFFERIGVDFDFDIDDNTGLNNKIDQLPTGAGTGSPLGLFDDRGHSIAYGRGEDGVPTADLDISIGQGSFGLTTPAFGGFDQAAGASFGFAILSDIETFFFINASQGDDRSNILQAPKVTLFNGQQAFVSDTSQRPFVTSVIPVVGDFAAAHQPVIVVLSEGTSLSVQAVVSSDRRFVRLTMVPFFSKIGDVETFTFNGKTTTDTGTTVQDPSDPDKNVTNNTTKTVEGTTVQLPTFAFTTVVTTVSVPDGGTVLLGGIKRLREGRNERGTPLLSKIPYISRLFKNVGIGRDAQSLMMMVTPRIIIQEEEEEKLGIAIEE